MYNDKFLNIDPAFLVTCLQIDTVNRNNYNEQYEEMGQPVARYYNGFIQFADNRGRVWVTRSNEFTRRHLSNMGFIVQNGGPVLSIDHMYVDQLIIDKIARLVHKGMSQVDIKTELIKDRDLQVALALCGDDAFRKVDEQDRYFKIHDSNEYNNYLDATSEYLDRYKYPRKFCEIVEPMVDHYMELRLQSVDSVGRSGR